MTAISILLSGFFDYAGLYPPAGLNLETGWRNYLSYRHGKHTFALGRLVVDLNRVEELRRTAGDSMRGLRLSVLAPGTANWNSLFRLIDDGMPIESIEIKADRASEIESITKHLPAGLTTYFEVPVDSRNSELLDAICAVGARVKLRMGGLIQEAFPSPQTTARILQELSDRHLSFKATAGLHHPLRSRHSFTDTPDSPAGMMNGFVNLCCASALIHFGGDGCDATPVLEETDVFSWQVKPDAITWRSFRWSAEQLQETRQEFLISIGSCSFTEPIEDLGALGWL
jgi:hypothetical protein